jgi:hypothetical protein
MKPVEGSSERFGECEICGQYVVNVYHQVESKGYSKSDGTKGWTMNGCSDVYGHEQCLISQRR